MKLRNILLTASAAGVLAGLALSDAHANTVTFSSITGTWYNGVPLSNVTIFANGSHFPQAYWGGNNPTSLHPNGDSGYTFATGLGSVTATVPPSPTPDFALGQFEHINQPITSGTSITGINLAVQADVNIDGNDQGFRVFQFHFTHDETPNGDNPCADGGTNGVGVDSAGCADHVTVNALATTETFDIGLDHYTLNIAGFEQGNVFTSSFWTREGQTNDATLMANIDLYSDVVINPTGGVPEPSTWLLGLTGFGFVGGLMLKRSRKGRLATV